MIRQTGTPDVRWHRLVPFLEKCAAILYGLLRLVVGQAFQPDYTALVSVKGKRAC